MASYLQIGSKTTHYLLLETESNTYAILKQNNKSLQNGLLPLTVLYDDGKIKCWKRRRTLQDPRVAQFLIIFNPSICMTLLPPKQCS